MVNVFLRIAIVCVLATPSNRAAAQDKPAATPAAPTATAPVTATREPSPADKAFEPLKKDFEHVYLSLSNKGGTGKEDRPVLEKLRDRFVAFGQQFPDDVRALAGELTISNWLGDNERVDACYERLIKVRPDDARTRMTWATSLKSRNRYAQAAQVLAGATFDDDQVLDAMHTLSDCYYADNQFEDALVSLTSIPQSAWDKHPERKASIDTLITQRRDDIEQWSKEQALRLAEESAYDLPLVRITTSRGPIVMALFENEAPNTVANFIELVGKKSYDDTRFHRMYTNMRIEGGDPNTRGGPSALAGTGTPGYYIADELGRNARHNFAGALGMVRSDLPNTAGCLFYLTVMPNSSLNGKRTVFGRVLEGLDIVRMLKQEDVIESMTILRMRDHAYTPQTLPLVPAATTQPVIMTDPITVPIEAPPLPPPNAPFDPTARAVQPATTQSAPPIPPPQ